MKIEFDSLVEAVARSAARRYSRRHALSVFSRVLLGGMLVPLLPVDRIARAAETSSGGKLPTGWDPAKAQTKDPTQCDYWRYCAADGYQCACCGGSPDTCPPGTDPSPSSWIGTCFNPDDKKHYIIAYRDCCGKGDACQRCPCAGFKDDKPPYISNRNNDTFWCFGAKNMVYHCSGSVVIGQA
jgi:methylamine dehydrogenase light chain